LDANSGSDSAAGISRYDWDFGDGNKGEGSKVVHEFGRSGNYTVQLLVLDSGNSSAVQTRKIKINPPELTLSGYGNRQTTRSMTTVMWSGAESETIDIYRDGILVASTRNDGKFIDLGVGSNSKTVRYILCESDSGRCSDEFVVKLQFTDSQMQIPADSAGISLFRNVQKRSANFR
jgi:PKD repeat protein